jgi:phytoene dehydrogenase-like protein
LVAALKLSHAGHRVVLLDGAVELGGRARSPVLGGHPVNLGPHALYRGGAAERTLRSLGLALTGWRPRPGDTWFWHREKLVPAPVTAGTLLGRHALPWQVRWQFVRRMVTLKAEGTPDVTVGAWLERISDPDVRALVRTMGRLASYCNAPELASAQAVAGQLAASLGGVTYLDGGWQSLIDQLTDRLEGAAVEVRLRSGVEAVDEGGRAVRLANGERVTVEGTVLAVGLKAAARLVPSLAEAAASATSSKVASLDLVLDGLPVPARRFVLGTREPLYWSVHSRHGATPVVAHAMWTLAPGERGAEKREALERWLDVLQPGWRAWVQASRFLPELCVLDSIPAVGSAQVARRAGERLVVTGDWTTRRFLLDAVLESASEAVRELTAACGEEPDHTSRAA